MPEVLTDLIWAFSWGFAAASGVLVGALIGLNSSFQHRSIAAIMSVGAGVLLSLASVKVASEALVAADAVTTFFGIVAGAGTVSIFNAVLTTAKNRKRCGECKAQPSEETAPGSGAAIALGTLLDAAPEALVVGVTLQAGRPDIALVFALAVSNVPEALSATLGMRLAKRSKLYIVSLWGGVALSTALGTALGFHFLSEANPVLIGLLKAYGAGALIAITAETMIPEAFHNEPRYSGVLAAVGFGALIVATALT